MFIFEILNTNIQVLFLRAMDFGEKSWLWFGITLFKNILTEEKLVGLGLNP